MSELMKNILKKTGLFLGIIVVLLGYLTINYMGFKERAVPILMYHGVGTGDSKNWGDMLISSELFEKQIQYLTERGYKVVSVEEVSERFRLNEDVEKYIAVSFDDGYENNYEYAFPVLQKYNVTATFYIIRNAIGNDGYMNEKQIAQMVDAGMRIGSHTMSHSDLTLIDESMYQRELAGSKMLLGQRFEKAIVESISYPNGAYNDVIVRKIMEYGYKEGVTGLVGVNTKDSYDQSPMTMYRVGVYDRGNGINDFAKTIEKAYFVGYFADKGIDLLKIRNYFANIL